MVDKQGNIVNNIRVGQATKNLYGFFNGLFHSYNSNYFNATCSIIILSIIVASFPTCFFSVACIGGKHERTYILILPYLPIVVYVFCRLWYSSGMPKLRSILHMLIFVNSNVKWLKLRYNALYDMI